MKAMARRAFCHALQPVMTSEGCQRGMHVLCAGALLPLQLVRQAWLPKASPLRQATMGCSCLAAHLGLLVSHWPFAESMREASWVFVFSWGMPKGPHTQQAARCCTYRLLSGCLRSSGGGSEHLRLYSHLTH